MGVEMEVFLRPCGTVMDVSDEVFLDEGKSCHTLAAVDGGRVNVTIT